MPDPIARKRLKKKMLDRWENEGGRIATDITGTDTSKPPTEKKSVGTRTSSPNDNATVDAPASPPKKRKPTRK